MRTSLVAVLAVAATAQAAAIHGTGNTNGTTIVKTQTDVHTVTSCSNHACQPTTTVPCPTISGHPSVSRNGTVPVLPTGATTGLPIKPTTTPAQATPSQPVTAGAASQNSLLAAGVAILMAAVAL